MKFLVINGPNLNLLGLREPAIYGSRSFAALQDFIRASAADAGVEVDLFQSNHEGAIVDAIQAAYGTADGIVINKCDGNNVDKCQLAATQFRNALHLFPAPESGWTPQVLTYSGFYNLGVKEIWDMVYRYMDFVKGNGYFEHRRNEQSKYWMYETINEQLRNSFFQNGQIVSRLAEAEAMVLSGRQTSFVAAKQLLDEYFASLR